MTRGWLLLALLLAVGDAAAAEPLGRLFFTPVQRAQLDAARSQKSRALLAPEPEAAAPVPEVVTYGGIVRRSDGRTTIWINDRPIDDGKAADRMPVTSRARPDGSVNLEVPQTSRSVNLKVGQSVEITSGSIEEPYARNPAIAKPQLRAATGGGSGTSPGVEGASPQSPSARKDRDDDDSDRR